MPPDTLAAAPASALAELNEALDAICFDVATLFGAPGKSMADPEVVALGPVSV